jgi:hypothetical protein
MRIARRNNPTSTLYAVTKKWRFLKIASQIPLEIDLVWLERKAIVRDVRFTLMDNKNSRGD